MADEKQKAKKAILGELESIKSLLEDNLEDEFDSEGNIEPPLLLQEVVNEEEEDEDILDDSDLDDMLFDDNAGLDDEDEADSVPLLTEAFNSVINHINQDAPTENSRQKTTGASDDSDIENLYADIYRSLNRDNAPTLEPVSDEEIELISQAKADTETKAKPLAQLSAKRSVAKSLFDDVDSDHNGVGQIETEAENKDSSVTTTTTLPAQPRQEPQQETEQPATITPQRKVAAALDGASSQQPAASEHNSTTAQQAGRFAQTSVQTSASNSNTLTANQTSTTNQRSLFSDASKSSAAAVNATQQALELNKKTENPFLPKHIRDRLQANRGAPGATPVTPSSIQSPVASGHDKSVEDYLVDEIIKAYLPKIEQELREKLRDLVQKRESDKKT